MKLPTTTISNQYFLLFIENENPQGGPSSELGKIYLAQL